MKSKLQPHTHGLPQYSPNLLCSSTLMAFHSTVLIHFSNLPASDSLSQSLHSSQTGLLLLQTLPLFPQLSHSVPPSPPTLEGPPHPPVFQILPPWSLTQPLWKEAFPDHRAHTSVTCLPIHGMSYHGTRSLVEYFTWITGFSKGLNLFPTEM